MKKITPFIFLFGLIGLLGWKLFYSKPHELPSALIGEDLPIFTLPNLFLDHHPFQTRELNGRVVLLNVWATWCSACRSEHEMLMKIKNEYHVPVFGINYKDNVQAAIDWLKDNGNPYDLIGLDSYGDAAIDLGVYGTPETFIIKDGKIIYRHIGILDQNVWDEKLYPIIKENGG